MNETKGHGFIPDVIEADHYVFGALPGVVLQPDGQWDAFLPPDEPQSREHLETYNCTGYGTLNAIEILIRRLFGTKPDFSERYVGVNAGTRPPGNSPHAACEAIRKQGLIEESLLPFAGVLSLLEYNSPDPMSDGFLARGRQWLNFFDFGHEWVWNGGFSPEKLKEALRYSPVALSVHAWVWNSEGVYIKPPGLEDNHWTVCYGYEEGKYWKIFDSYAPFQKKVAWDTDFMQAKRFHLAKKDPVTEAQKLSILEKIVQLLTLQVPLIIQKLFNPSYMTETPNLVQFCKAIQEHEGWTPPNKDNPRGSRSYRNKNPGNIRCNAVMNALASGKDDRGYCTFSTDEIGFQALVRLVERAIEGKSVHYKPEMTLVQFFGVYAPSSDKNDPNAYARFVGRKLGVDPALFTIKQLA